MAKHNELGCWGEELAATWLQQQGYVIAERDWKMGHRDIDIIAMDGSVVVFVEVKTRRNRVFSDPETAVDYQKLKNLQKAINCYVKTRCIRQEIRFDVVTVVGTPEGGEPEISLIKDFPLF